MTQTGRFTPPPRQIVLYGVPVAQALETELSRLGAKRIVLVTNTSLASPGGLADTVTAALGSRSVVRVTGVGAHSPRGDVTRIVTALREHRADVVVGFGGGSVCDAIKVACLCLSNDVTTSEDISRLRPPGPHIKAPTIPYVAIPTTLSAGEFTRYAGVTDEAIQRKELFWHEDAAPDVVILDPALTVATPPRLWFSTGIRALDHAVETWCSINVTPVVEATSLHALRLLVPALRACGADPTALGPRLDALIGAWLSVQGVATGVDLGASHGIGHMLGGTAGMPHGETSCVMLPHVLRYNLAVNAGRQASLAAAMGSPDTPVADTVQTLVASLGLPGRLRDANVPRELLPRIADESMHDIWIPTNPRPITESAQVLALLEAAW